MNPAAFSAAMTAIGVVCMLLATLVSAAVSWGLQRGRVATAERDVIALSARVALIEADLQHKADKADISEVKAMITALVTRFDQMLAMMAGRQ